jgi:branched-chain amino acid aminotransferase
MRLLINGKEKKMDEAFNLPQESEISVFESIKCYSGIPFRLEEHLDRLYESAKTVGLAMKRSRAQFKKEILTSVKPYRKEDKFVRIAYDGRASYVLVLDRRRSPQIYEQGVDLVTSVTRRHFAKAVPSEIKTSAFFNCVLGTLDFVSNTQGQVGSKAPFETIFLDADGYVTEAASWNIFIVKLGTILTPEVGILRGVTRQFVIKCAALEHLPVHETNLMRHDVWNADEVFITNTSGEIVPVKLLDSRKIGTCVPGEITKRLHKRFRREVKKELGLK